MEAGRSELTNELAHERGGSRAADPQDKIGKTARKEAIFLREMPNGEIMHWSSLWGVETNGVHYPSLVRLEATRNQSFCSRDRVIALRKRGTTHVTRAQYHDTLLAVRQPGLASG